MRQPLFPLEVGLWSILITVHSWKKSPHNIYLRVDFETLYSRIQNDKAMQRPLFLNHTKEEFKKIFEGRLPLYEDIATHIVDVKDKSTWRNCGDYSMLVGYLGPKGILHTWCGHS